MKKDEFLKAIDTLKLYRRAELMDAAGRGLISTFLCRPFTKRYCFEAILKPNTTILIGRKGTGKSTIFQRAQEELNKNSTSTWAYIDIRLYINYQYQIYLEIHLKILKVHYRQNLYAGFTRLKFLLLNL